MRRAYKHLVLVALASMFVGLGVTASHPESSRAQTAPSPDPNIVFILTDDMRKDDLKARYMPQTQRLVANEGMTFKNAFVSTPLCCPARATIMRGQYAHNTGIWYNVNHFNPDGHDGGWEGYLKNGWEEDNVATHLDAAGYETGLFGKYLNQYGEGIPITEPPPPRPAGWDKWFAFLHPINYYDYDVNVNYDVDDDNATTRQHYGTKASDYSTDVLKSETLNFIDESVDANKPFFAYVAPKAPHGPATPAPRDRRAFDREKAPQLPSFDEPDVSDKPPWIKNLRRLTSDDKAAINKRHEDRVESLQAVDDLVRAVVDTLSVRDPVTGQAPIDNTYIVFTSDNGWFHGEHRIRQGKGRPYEEAPRVPLVISGPGVKAGSSADELVLDTDYLPTFTELAGVPTPDYVDGRSLLPVLAGSPPTWRTAILLEGRAGNDPEIPVDRNYNAIRTSNSKYVVYEGGFKELYNLNPADNPTNPYELTNLYNNSNNTWGDTEPPLTDLARRLEALRGCQAEDDPETPEEETPCQTAEDGP